jgi:predicted GNAT superfamily acetyltransferase
MIGFTLAVAGWRDHRPMLHSHMTAVLEGYRNFGVGGHLKILQREDALTRGIRLVEWTFDPLQVKNGYFNLVRLGAIVRRIQPNLYGITSSPLHGGLPTDRFVAEWHLTSPRVRRAMATGSAVEYVRKPRTPIEIVHIPAQMEEWKRSDRDRAVQAQTEVREQFLRLFARGWVATGLERTDDGANYILEKI